MNPHCQRPNPLVRSGSDRKSRVIQALDVNHFQVDERSVADFILFARRYAENITFHGSDQTLNWKKFFEKDSSVTLARIANLPLSLGLHFKDDVVRFLQQSAAQPAPVVLEYLALYMRLPLLLLNEIAHCRGLLPQGDPLTVELEKWAGKEIVSDLVLLKTFVLGAESLPLSGFSDQALDKTKLNSDVTVDDPLLVPQQFIELISSLSWNDDAAQFFSKFETLDDADLTSAVADSSPFATSNDFNDQIDDALRYNLLVNAVEHLLSAMQSVIDAAQLALEDALNRDDHEPAYGLWLTFLKLYAAAQDNINEFTGRHLDFYYRDILQMANQPKQGDQVPLVFELAKHHAEYLLEAGTLFKAGKDAGGIERLYQLESDTVINQAVIKELRSFFHAHSDGSVPYAAIKTDSADGVDEKLDKENPQWPIFGPVHENSLAEIGFAVADEKLRLSDGQREINVSIEIQAGFTGTLQNTFAAALTTEKEWLYLNDSQLTVSKNGSRLEFDIELEGDQPAITPYDPALHLFNFSTSLPMLRIWVLPASGQFEAWRHVSFTSITLKTEVAGTRSFSLGNDFGVIDTAKPFLPFGPQPTVNSHFIVGGREIFSKPIAAIEIKPTWKEELGFQTHYSQTALPYAVAANIEWLAKGRWVLSSASPEVPMLIRAGDEDIKFGVNILFWHWVLTGENLFDIAGISQVLFYLFDFGFVFQGEQSGAAFDELDQQYGITSTEGFIRFTLKNQFGHQQYPQTNALALIKKAGGTGSLPNDVNYVDSIPQEPYTPTVTDLTVNYVTTADSPQQFFHQCPFGTQKVGSTNTSLLPDFSREGELYIGLEKAVPPQSISLLFHSIEGSANPLKNPASLSWHYLQGDQWQEIKATDITDTSASLSGSGIIQFELPAAADTDHAILPSDLHWLRLSVAQDSDAVCVMKALYTQAANAIWYDNNNSDLMLADPLPANTIAKLKTPDSAVKKISQPLESFGGKPEELDTDYYQRVSERLRHKKRASTMWDYENLVLQEFPQVYKVRCLNHTELCRDVDNNILADNGMHPGSVVVVPIPVIDSASASDPHRPYNTTKTLADIDAFLRERISPFVNLEVQNPKIEEIQFEFKVGFHEFINDSGYYLKLLETEIKAFMMPWSVGGASAIDFNGRWYKSTLVNFIDERPYVDYVKDVQMFHRIDINDESMAWRSVDKNVIKADSARSILVSHRAHVITLHEERVV